MSCNGHGGEDHGHSHGGGKDLEAPLLKDNGHGHAHGGGAPAKKEGGCGHAHDGGGDNGHGHAHGGCAPAKKEGGCGHAHDGGGAADNENVKALQKAIVLALFFMVVELIGGYVANSLAIMTDAAHMLSDVAGFVMSLIGLKLSEMVATEAYTYGFKQAEVIGAFLSILVVWALTATLLMKAFERIQNPEAIDAKMMFVISVIGLLVNLALMKVLGHNHSHSHGTSCGGDESVAIKAAVAHVIGDIVQSLGVCLAAVLIWWQPFDIGHTSTGLSNWIYADPMCTVLFGILVLQTTKETIVYAMDNLMVRAPKDFDQASFLEKLAKIPNVESVHDLHVWRMGSAEFLCTCHVMINGVTNQTGVLRACIKVAQTAGIGHSTFQIEIVGEFDPALETYGGIHPNPITGETTPKIKNGHGHGHEAHGDGGHQAHGDGGCCGGHGGDDGGQAHGGHGDGGHSGHGGHDGGHGH